MPVTTLALRVDAPMQSWGTRSRFISRDTATEPTKSGIVGLLAAAYGIGRDDDHRIRELAALRMGVRVEREGLLERDYHVTENVPNTQGKAHRSVVSNRYYLADALFLVLLEGDAAMMARLEDAVRRPRWPLFFGRKAFVPASPLVERDAEGREQWGTGMFPRPLDEVLEEHPWLEDRPQQRGQASGAERGVSLRAVIDTPASDPLAELRHDFPESFRPRDRRFRSRTVRVRHINLPTTR